MCDCWLFDTFFFKGGLSSNGIWVIVPFPICEETKVFPSGKGGVYNLNQPKREKKLKGNTHSTLTHPHPISRFHPKTSTHSTTTHCTNPTSPSLLTLATSRAICDTFPSTTLSA